MARIVRADEDIPLVPFTEPTFSVEPGRAPAEPEPQPVETPEEMYARARAEAEAMVQAAEAEGVRIRAEAEQAGRAAGEAAGKAEGLLIHQQAADTLAAVQEELRKDYRRLEAELLPQVTSMAAAIVHRMLGDFVAEKPEVMAHVVQQALTALSERGAVTVRVHPSLCDVVERERDVIIRTYEKVDDLAVVADTTIAPGGCIIEAEFVSIDATVDVALAHVRTAVQATTESAPDASADAGDADEEGDD